MASVRTRGTKFENSYTPEHRGHAPYDVLVATARVECERLARRLVARFDAATAADILQHGAASVRPSVATIFSNGGLS